MNAVIILATVLAVVSTVASGIWVAVALVRAISVRRR